MSGFMMDANRTNNRNLDLRTTKKKGWLGHSSRKGARNYRRSKADLTRGSRENWRAFKTFVWALIVAVIVVILLW